MNRRMAMGLLAALGLSACATTSKSVVPPESAGTMFGYATVAAAAEGVRAKPGVSMKTTDEWLEFEEPGNRTLTQWSFVLPSHPAHPMAVKRTLFAEKGLREIDMKVLCEGDQAECQKLALKLDDLNNWVMANANALEHKGGGDGPAINNANADFNLRFPPVQNGARGSVTPLGTRR